MRIYYKLNLLIISLLVILTVLVAGSVNIMVSQALEEEMQDKELAIAGYMASILADPLLNRDVMRVHAIIDDLMMQNADVRYIYVVGFDGIVVAHTFEGGFPVALVTANPIPPGENTAIRGISADGESVRDVGVRLIDGMDAKTYIGFSRARLIESIEKITYTIIGITALILLFGVGLSFFLTRTMTKPIKALVDGTKRAGGGDLDFMIDVTSRDEIGMLTDSFNQMTAERKSAEGALRESESRRRRLHSMLRLMCDNLPDLIWAKDIDGEFMFANFACCNNLLNARDTDEPVGKTDMYFAEREKQSHPENPSYHTFGETCTSTDDAVLESRKAIRTEESGNIKGGFVVLDVLKAPFWDEEGKLMGTVGCAKDITERKAAEEALRESEEKFKAVLNAVPDLMIVLDAEGRYRDIFTADPDLLLAPTDQLLGKTIHEVMPEKNAQQIQSVINQTLSTGKLQQIEYVLDIDGVNRWFSGRAAKFMFRNSECVLWSARDITERKHAEERIEHLNSVLKAIGNINQLIVTEKERGSLLQKACDILLEARGYETVWFGYLSNDETFDTVVGSGFAEDINRFCESVMDGNHPPCIKKALAGKEMVVVMDTSGECGDCLFKDTHAGRGTVVIRIEHAGALFGLLGTSLAADVTLDDEEEGLLTEVASDIALALHNMKVEEAHKRAEDQIKASLKEKEVLLREIHHRVKNNLQVASSLLNMQARAAKNEDSIDVLTESKNRINAMALIHAQLYESSNLAEINMRGFVNKLLVQLLQTYPVQGAQITKAVSVADYPVPISRAVPVGLIVNELLSNALKHAFVGRKEGKIKVSLTASEEGRINLTVSDDGVGLPPGFDINETGTLGLRLIKILTEDQLHGTLEVISEEGTTFNIEFDIRTDDGV